MSTKIEWAKETWNPVTGCSKISEGCQNCYAQRMSRRLAGRFGYPKAPNNFRPTFHRDRLTQPRVWKKPRRIFVCSMADLFHDDVPIEWFGAVFDQVAKCPQHTFMFLTKRPLRMAHFMDEYGIFNYGVLPNVWLGATIENDKHYDRIETLLSIPAAIRFVSVEPMLGPVELTFVGEKMTRAILPLNARAPHLNWVICGGESGRGARPMHPTWVRSIRDQCQAAGVPFMFKQWGQWAPAYNWMPALPSKNKIIMGGNGHARSCGSESFYDDDWIMGNYGKKDSGRLLDGKIWDQFPKQ